MDEGHKGGRAELLQELRCHPEGALLRPKDLIPAWEEMLRMTGSLLLKTVSANKKPGFYRPLFVQ